MGSLKYLYHWYGRLPRFFKVYFAFYVPFVLLVAVALIVGWL